MSADPRRGWLERATVPTVAVAFLVAVALVFGVLSVVAEESPTEDALERIPPEDHVRAVAHEWLDAWARGDTDAMRERTDGAPEQLAAAVASFGDDLGVDALRATPSAPVVTGSSATVPVDVVAELASTGSWSYATELHVVLPADADSPADWKVRWNRAALHPALRGDRRLRVAVVPTTPAPLLASDGTPIAGPGSVAVSPAVAQIRGALADAFALERNGVAAADIVAVSPDGAKEVVGHVDGVAPTAVRTTLDLRVQSAGEAALADVTNPAALVAIRPSTGEIVAAVSNPPRGFVRALRGRYPPGSTFKVVTTAALLGAGVTPDTPATCPEVATVNGREFRNAEGAALGDIPFRRAFYESCNTAFVQLAASIDGQLLVDAASRFGFNADPGVEVATGQSSFPPPHSVVDQASASIGQGRVLATPLQMASVAATVAAGTRRPPTFRAVDVPPVGDPLPDGVAATLRELMLLAVAQGTGTAARLPGEPVAGKTGTAEFGTADPPQTHAWFIGFRGDLAFAVIVEDGGFGGRVAAPLARAFVSALG